MVGTASTARRARDFTLAMLLLLLPGALLKTSHNDPGKVRAVDRAILYVAAPVQNAVVWTLQGVKHAWQRYLFLVSVEKENDVLRARNEVLREQVAALSRVNEDASDLESLAFLRAVTKEETVGARVVSVGIDAQFRVSRIVIDRGEGEIEPGMPVLSPEGLVGRIGRTYGRYADVLLAIDPRSAIDVVVPRTGARGIVRGLGGQKGYACRLDYLPRTEEIRVGDWVTTSGVGELFPKGIPVGTILSASTSENALHQDAEVAPAADFSRLERVLVIVSPRPRLLDLDKSKPPASGRALGD